MAGDRAASRAARERLKISKALRRVPQHHVRRRVGRVAARDEVRWIDVVTIDDEQAVDGRADCGPFIGLTNVRLRQQPMAGAIGLEHVNLLGCGDRSAQTCLHRRHTHQTESVHCNPGAAAIERRVPVLGREGHDVTGDAVERLTAAQRVAIRLRQGNGQRQRRHAFRLDDREPGRSTVPLERHAVDADVALLEIDPIRRLVDHRL